MGEGEAGWKHKAEYYEREHHRLVKELLAIKKRINSLNLESGWDGEGEKVHP